MKSPYLAILLAESLSRLLPKVEIGLHAKSTNRFKGGFVDLPSDLSNR
jgi:hypothetical protein